MAILPLLCLNSSFQEGAPQHPSLIPQPSALHLSVPLAYQLTPGSSLKLIAPVVVAKPFLGLGARIWSFWLSDQQGRVLPEQVALTVHPEAELE